MFCLHNKLFSLLTWLPILLLILLIFPNISPVHAASQSKAKQQTIDITAQYLLLDEKKGISEYKGKVSFIKGTLTIKADSVTLYYDGEKLIKALITGFPADVQHQPDNEARVHSQANEMEYFVAEERLILKGQAFVDQGDRHFSGEYIEYDTRQRTITAAGSQNVTVNTENSKNSPPKGRVHVIIGPTGDVLDNAENNENKD